ncbi:MAG: FIST C-terminal domain-containing protein [Lachnospiraceae bacterium]|nr:FIST C-terminal domain-containing protein [Lachnospiraceae bacterium]
MKSFQAVTNEVDDIKTAINELKAGIDTSRLLKNTCGLVFCGFETNLHELVEALNEAFDFPFIGCSAIGLLSTSGYSECSISMLVLTADDVEFSVGMSDAIESIENLESFARAYRDCKAKTELPEKLIFSYVPFLYNVTFDDIVEKLDETSNHVPVYGGVASDDWTFDASFVFTNEEVSDSKGVIMLVSGNVKPIFVLETSTTLTTNLHKVVTRVEGTTVYELDGRPTLEFFKEMGMPTEKSFVIMDYLNTPFLATKKTRDGDEIDILRTLGAINHDDGSCQYIGKIEEGSELNVVLISKEDIEKSVKKAFDKILYKLEKSEDYKYSAIICSSCAARYSMLVADKDTEGRAYEGRIPEGINVQGVYIYGEFCPAHGKHNDGLYNALSNSTFTILAI